MEHPVYNHDAIVSSAAVINLDESDAGSLIKKGSSSLRPHRAFVEHRRRPSRRNRNESGLGSSDTGSNNSTDIDSLEFNPGMNFFPTNSLSSSTSTSASSQTNSAFVNDSQTSILPVSDVPTVNVIGDVVTPSSTIVAPITHKAPLKKQLSFGNPIESLYVNGKRCLISIDHTDLIYEREIVSANSGQQSGRQTIALDSIIAVYICMCARFSVSHSKSRKFDPCACCRPSVSNSCSESGISKTTNITTNGNNPIVKLFYAVSDRKNGYEPVELLLTSHHDPRVVQPSDDQTNNNQQDATLIGVFHKLRDIIQDMKRPRRLYVFINPAGGKGDAEKIFTKKIKPLLELAGVQYRMCKTVEAGHAQKLLENARLEEFDAIVGVGGDGMFSEILNGVLKRTQQENELDFNDFETDLVPPNLQLGIIPAGSTDAIVYSTAGVKRVINSTLLIVLGRTVPVDVISVHNRRTEKLERYCVTFVGYGFMGDVLKNSEKNRALGPVRYTLAGAKKFFQHKSYHGELRLWIEPTDGDPKRPPTCTTDDCKTCKRASERKCAMSNELREDESPACVSIRAKFLAINGASMSGRCGMSKHGMAPNAHIGNGATDLILVSKCSRWNFFKYLLRIRFARTNQLEFDFLCSYRVRQFEFIPIVEPKRSNGSNNSDKQLAGQSVWNCDGELVRDAAIQVKNHLQTISVFGTGIPQ